MHAVQVRLYVALYELASLSEPTRTTVQGQSTMEQPHVRYA